MIPVKQTIALPDARQTQRKSRMIILGPAVVAAALLGAGLVLYFAPLGQDLASNWWSTLSPTAKDLITMASLIGAGVAAAATSLHLGRRIYLLRNRTHSAIVAIIGGGGYAAFMRRFVQSLPRRVRDLVVQGYVLTSDSLSSHQGDRWRPDCGTFTAHPHQ